MSIKGKGFKFVSIAAHILVLGLIISYSKNEAAEKPLDISDTDFTQFAEPTPQLKGEAKAETVGRVQKKSKAKGQ